eukprot:680258-Hanusia_phi.AAC.3
MSGLLQNGLPQVPVGTLPREGRGTERGGDIKGKPKMLKVVAAMASVSVAMAFVSCPTGSSSSVEEGIAVIALVHDDTGSLRVKLDTLPSQPARVLTCSSPWQEERCSPCLCKLAQDFCLPLPSLRPPSRLPARLRSPGASDRMRAGEAREPQVSGSHRRRAEM